VSTEPPTTQTACFAFVRQTGAQNVLVALNFTSQDQQVRIPALGHGQIVVSTGMDREGEINLAEFSLRGNEGVIIEVA
jgi:hypothetical protein